MPNPPRVITANGRTLTLDQWSIATGLPKQTICSRLDSLGWDADRCMSTGVDRRFRRGGRHPVGAPRPVPRLRDDGKGVAIVRWRQGGRDHFRSFGAWATPEATAAYRRFAAEWATGAYDAAPATAAPGALVYVSEVVVGWLTHADREYRKLGRRTSEYGICRAACCPLVDLYATLPAAEFGPAQLRACRDVWVKAGRSRSTCNGYATRLVRAFRWAAGQSLVPPAVVAAIEAVEPLKAGRTAAPDLPRRQSADDDAVAATLAKLPATPRGDLVRAMVQVQRLAGLRPQHVTEMRVGDLDRSGEVWRYVPPPAGTKTLHLDKRPTFYFGPQTQALLAPLCEGKALADHVFTYRHGDRTRRVPRGGYCVAVGRACGLAGVRPWTPHQLRHALATAVAARFESIDHAAAAIGDTAATAQAVYVHVDPRERAAIEVARAMG